MAPKILTQTPYNLLLSELVIANPCHVERGRSSEETTVTSFGKGEHGHVVPETAYAASFRQPSCLADIDQGVPARSAASEGAYQDLTEKAVVLGITEL